MILFLSNYYPGDLIKNEKGVACGTYEGRKKMHTGFCWGNLKKRDSLKQLVLNGRIILKLIFKKYVSMAWIGFIFLSVARCGGGLFYIG
jgi:hypothetical protein